MSSDPLPLSRAILAQLSAEFSAHDTSAKEVAGRIGKDYNTFRRYVIGEREMPVTILLAALEALELSPAVFMARAEDRQRQAERKAGQ